MGHQLLTCDDPVRIDRSCHIRVGANADGAGTLGPILYTEANHASVGILTVSKAPDPSYDIIVTTDWVAGEESCAFGVEPDAQLAALGVVGGVTGGATAVVRLYATRTIPRYPSTGSTATWPTGAQLPPHGSWAGLGANFALTLKSVIPL